MMSEKPTSGMGGNPNRQKIVAMITMVVIVVIIWQVIGLFRGGSAQHSAPVITSVTSAVSGKAVVPPMESKPAPQPAQSQAVQTDLNIVPVSKEQQMYKLQQDAQQKYITSLNELQTLRIQKEIAETNQAIAAAKLATVTTEKNIADLLTKPVVPTLPPSAYQPLASSPGQPSSAMPMAQPEPVTSGESEAPYVLISVSMQLDTWNAVIGYQGKPYQVKVGTVLPPDGSEVVDIDNSSVVLEKNGKKRTITLVPPV